MHLASLAVRRNPPNGKRNIFAVAKQHGEKQSPSVYSLHFEEFGAASNVSIKNSSDRELLHCRRPSYEWASSAHSWEAVVLHQRSAVHVPPRSQHALQCNVQKFANLAFYSGHTTTRRWLALFKRRALPPTPLLLWYFTFIKEPRRQRRWANRANSLDSRRCANNWAQTGFLIKIARNYSGARFLAHLFSPFKTLHRSPSK